MKSVSTYYTDFVTLESFIRSNHILNSPSLLIQVFTAINKTAFIEEILENITYLLPNAIIIGSTTDGEIMSGRVSIHQTVISFTAFEKTQLKTYTAKHQKDGYFTGKLLANTLIEKDTKLIIAFADGLNTNGESFLEGINDVDKNVIVAGGLAGDNATFTQTYVFTKDEIIGQGAVAVALNSRYLNVRNDYRAPLKTPKLNQHLAKI